MSLQDGFWRQAPIWGGLLLAALCLTGLIAIGLSELFPEAALGRQGGLSLAHGMKVVLAWMFGWMSLVIVVPVVLIYSLFINGPEQVSGKYLALQALKSALVPLSFDVARWLALDSRRSPACGSEWRWLLVVGLISAVVVELFRYGGGCCGAETTRQQINGLVVSLLGDMLGLILVLGALMLWFRWRRRAG